MKNNKITNLRFIAILLVIFAHSIIIFKNEWQYYSPLNENYVLNLICNFIYIFHMPLFFSISGYLFIHNCRAKYNFKDLIIKKGKRLIIPALIIGVFYVLPIRYFCDYQPYIGKNIFYNLFLNIIFGLDNGHLWYCYSLFIIFIISYFLEKLHDKKIKLLILCILTLLGYILPTYIGNALSNILWFYIGHFIRENESTNEFHSKKIIYIFLTLVSAIFYFIVYIANIKYGNYIMLILKYLFCFGFIPLIYKIIPNNKNNIITSISDNSFGIYLFHSPLIYITFSNFNYLSWEYIIILNFVVFGFISYLITIIIKKTKIKFIIGG